LLRFARAFEPGPKAEGYRIRWPFRPCGVQVPAVPTNVDEETHKRKERRDHTAWGA